jgi:uncharacterized FlgJ-related protein
MQCIKDRTESFDDYFPSIRKKNCKLKHVRNWLKLFKDIHNNDLKPLKRTELFNDKGHLNIKKIYKLKYYFALKIIIVIYCSYSLKSFAVPYHFLFV